jgi:hypothetical protein
MYRLRVSYDQLATALTVMSSITTTVCVPVPSIGTQNLPSPGSSYVDTAAGMTTVANTPAVCAGPSHKLGTSVVSRQQPSSEANPIVDLRAVRARDGVSGWILWHVLSTARCRRVGALGSLPHSDDSPSPIRATSS